MKLANLALGVLLLSLTPYPLAFTAAVRQAEAHRVAREYHISLAAYRQATELETTSPLPWLRMGELLLLQHRFQEAAVAFDQAERRGGGASALLGLGESYAGRGDWAAALQRWGAALSLAPHEARVYIALGRGSMAQGHLEQAAAFLTQALRLRPAAADAAEVHRLLGRLLIGDYPDQAATHFRQAGDADMLTVLEAASAEPNPAYRALFLGIAFLQRSEIPLARHHLEQAVALSSLSPPTDAEASAYLAYTLDQLGETISARELLTRALELNSDSALAYYFLGLHERQAGNLDKAQAALWQALLRDPENAALRVEMAEIFQDLGDYSHAEEWYQGAVEAAPGSIEFHFLLAHFYLDHLYRVEEGGIPAAEAAVALAPNNAHAHDLLGWAYHLTGRHTEGEQSLLQALALDPDLVSAHYHLGSLYARTGRRDLARRHLQRAIDLDTGGYYREHAEKILNSLK